MGTHCEPKKSNIPPPSPKENNGPLGCTLAHLISWQEFSCVPFFYHFWIKLMARAHNMDYFP